jgi:predicted nucleotidyltransferase
VIPVAVDELLAYCEASDDVLGAYLFGSRGRGVGVDERSDWDVWIVARDDDALARIEERFPLAHGAPVEVASSTLDGLRGHGAIGSRNEWARYQHAHVDLRVDKTGGELERVLAEKELIPPEHREEVVRDALGGFVNSSYRSLRYGTRLDAAESIPYALRAIFALAGRVRPFNKYLDWELRQHPVEGWPAETLLPLVAGILDRDRASQHELFRLVERDARNEGFGQEIDDWEPDVAWLRGEADYRAP